MIVGKFVVPPKEAVEVIERMTHGIASAMMRMVASEPEYPEAVCSAVIEIVLRMVREEPHLGAVIKKAIDEVANIN